MAAHIIEIIEAMICLMLAAGIMWAYVRKCYDPKPRRIFIAGLIAGICAAAVMSYMKNATNMVDTSYWNFRIYLITLIAFALFIIFTGIEKYSGRLPSSAALAVMIFMLMFYTLPDVFASPYQIYVAETTLFSSSYIIRISGVIIGFIITLVAAFAMNRLSMQFEKKQLFVFIIFILAVNEVKQVANALNIMMTKRMIPTNHNIFLFVKYVINHRNTIIYLTLAVVGIMGIILFVKSLHVNEPYYNPAMHRKIRAKWRNIRRWGFTGLCCIVCCVLFMTVINTYVSAETELSPTEEATVVNGQVIVTFDEVSDGHLHRFGYTTENGVEVRFIVIQKPGSSAYGVGMDACDICGQTGYYENGNGEVVCNRCDVVMNINTIGFSGGCNPKVIEYLVQDQKIIIDVEQLEQYEKDFA